MRAVVLVGGAGTRLRPLTETIPKPLVPLMGRPQLDHVLDHLERHDRVWVCRRIDIARHWKKIYPAR